MSEYFTKFKQKTTIRTETINGLNHIDIVEYDEDYNCFSSIYDSHTDLLTYDGKYEQFQFINSEVLNDSTIVRDIIFTQIQNILGNQYGYTVYCDGDEIVVSLFYKNETDAMNVSPISFSEAMDKKEKYVRAKIYLQAAINGIKLDKNDLCVIIPREMEIVDNDTINIVNGLKFKKYFFKK